MLVENVLTDSIFNGVRYVFFKNPFIQTMGSLFPDSSVYMLKTTAVGFIVIYVTRYTTKSIGNIWQNVMFIPDFIFMTLSLNFFILTFLVLSEKDSQPKIEGSLQKQREART
jgi:hypothetical protein